LPPSWTVICVSVFAVPCEADIEELFTVNTVLIDPLKSICTLVSVPSDESNFANASVPFQSVTVDEIGVVVVNGPEMFALHKLGKTQHKAIETKYLFILPLSKM
jgi:hypothetical protein